ncbi:Asp23/Gls24 family envelope stress response protein [Exiguobacterium sp. TRN 1102]|uniref:Asp23/Gls24 family envelope stress response protein n=1 Tax=Exiguobacterium TaxID=33986 RepID=UPI003390D472
MPYENGMHSTEGDVNVSRHVVEMIAAVAVKETKHVSFTQEDTKLSERALMKHVKVDESDKGITINLSLYIAYGQSIIKTVTAVQERITQDMDTMLAMTPRSVNVKVVGIQL